MQTSTASPPAPVLSVAELTGVLSLSVWVLTRILAKEPDLAGRVFRSGGRRMVRTEDVELFRAAVRDSA